MEPPTNIVVDAAKAYAFRLERGWSPARAREYVSSEFGLAPETVREAISYAQRGIKIGQKIGLLDPTEPLSKALTGQARPGDRVKVRMLVEIEHPGSASTFATVYPDMSWDATLAETQAEAIRLALAAGKDYGPVGDITADPLGPTLWA